ncbi:hypothetical protein QR98_0007340, partial [Sarcoptes scabiei]
RVETAVPHHRPSSVNNRKRAGRFSVCTGLHRRRPQPHPRQATGPGVKISGNLSQLLPPLCGLIVDHRNEVHPDELEQTDEFAHVPALLIDAQLTGNRTDLSCRRRLLQARLCLRGGDLGLDLLEPGRICRAGFTLHIHLLVSCLLLLLICICPIDPVGFPPARLDYQMH